MVENKDNEKLLSLEHRTNKEARVLNLEFDSVQDKSKWKESLKGHIDYLDALYAEQVTQQAKALEKPKCINALTIWMKANAPHVIVPKAQEYATKLYDSNVINIESVASKIDDEGLNVEPSQSSSATATDVRRFCRPICNASCKLRLSHTSGLCAREGQL